MAVLHLLVPAGVLAALGVFATVESDDARHVSTAEQEIRAGMDAFDDPAVIELSRTTAYLDAARLQAPFVTAELTDAQVVAMGERVCAELTSGIPWRALSIHRAWAEAPRDEPAAIIRAAHATYCSEVWLSQ